MELKQTKPIHLKCPKCGYDFAYNTNHIEEEIDTLKKEITSIMGEIQRYKREHRNYSKELPYKNLQCALKSRQYRLADTKKSEEGYGGRNKVTNKYHIPSTCRGTDRERKNLEVA